MQNKKLQRFDFNFDKTYKRLRNDFRGGFLPRTRYYYLEGGDFFQDVVLQALKYIEKNDLKEVSENQFESIYWTTLKWLKLASCDKTVKKSHEFKNFVSRDQQEVEEVGSTQSVDLDYKWLKEHIDSNFPTISKIMEGHSFTSASHDIGITSRGVSLRFHKEVKKLKSTRLI